MRALRVNVASPDSGTTLSLRPERITVRPAAGETENVFDATVEELIYLGDHVRTRVKLLGTNDFIIKVPNAYGHQQPTVGATVPAVR